MAFYFGKITGEAFPHFAHWTYSAVLDATAPRTLANGTTLRDIPFFVDFSNDIDRLVVPQFASNGLVADPDFPFRGDHGGIQYRWAFFKRQSADIAVTIQLWLSVPNDPQIKIEGQVFTLPDPAIDDPQAFDIIRKNFATLSPKIQRESPSGLALSSSASLDTKCLNPYRRLTHPGHGMMERFHAKKRRSLAQLVIGTIIRLTAFVTMSLALAPFGKLASAKFRSWTHGESANTLALRQKIVAELARDIPDYVDHLMNTAQLPPR